MAAPSGVDPQAWAALLRWSMQQQKEGDGTADSEVTPMSEENKKWLTQVMQEGVVDLVQRAKEIIDQLRDEALNPAGEAAKTAAAAAAKGGASAVASAAAASSSSSFELPEGKLDELLERVEELQDIVEQIDFAMSLVQIGGVPPLLAIVLTPNLPGELRAEVLSVLATVAQNNPYAQDALLACRALPMAVALLLDAPPENGEEGGGEGTTTTTTTTTTPPALRVKALHFLSCLSRGHPPAEEAFFRGAPIVAIDRGAAAAAAAAAATAAAAAGHRRQQV